MRQLLILCKLLQKYSLQIYIRRCVQMRKRLKVKCKWKGRKFEWASEWVNKQTNEIRDKQRERKVWAKKKGWTVCYHITEPVYLAHNKWNEDDQLMLFFFFFYYVYLCAGDDIYGMVSGHIYTQSFFYPPKKKNIIFFFFSFVFSPNLANFFCLGQSSHNVLHLLCGHGQFGHVMLSGPFFFLVRLASSLYKGEFITIIKRPAHKLQ